MVVTAVLVVSLALAMAMAMAMALVVEEVAEEVVEAARSKSQVQQSKASALIQAGGWPRCCLQLRRSPR